MNRQRRLKRLEALEARQPAPPPSPLNLWLKTLSDDDVDLLAEAAVAVKAGDPIPVDPVRLSRLEGDYLTFKSEVAAHARQM